MLLVEINGINPGGLDRRSRREQGTIRWTGAVRFFGVAIQDLIKKWTWP